MSILKKIIWTPLDDKDYIKEETKKSQIYLHHTAGSTNPYEAVEWWKKTPERVATSFIIGGRPSGKTTRWKDGDIIQCFSGKYWGWHLGLKASDLIKGGKTSTWLNSNSIGIEIAAWGYLRKTDVGFLSWSGAIIADIDVCELATPYRGHKYYHKYSDAQLETTRELLVYLGANYNIDLKYKGDAIFDIDPRCLKGENGIFTHTSCRKDKTDCFPQPSLIQMLQSL